IQLFGEAGGGQPAAVVAESRPRHPDLRGSPLLLPGLGGPGPLADDAASSSLGGRGRQPGGGGGAGGLRCRGRAPWAGGGGAAAGAGVRLRRGGGATSPPRYDTPLNRGVEARLLFARGDWLQVELAGGEVGWVPRRSVLIEDS